MVVKELIEILKTYDEDKEVIIGVNNNMYWIQGTRGPVIGSDVYVIEADYILEI